LLCDDLLRGKAVCPFGMVQKFGADIWHGRKPHVPVPAKTLRRVRRAYPQRLGESVTRSDRRQRELELERPSPPLASLCRHHGAIALFVVLELFKIEPRRGLISRVRLRFVRVPCPCCLRRMVEFDDWKFVLFDFLPQKSASAFVPQNSVEPSHEMNLVLFGLHFSSYLKSSFVGCVLFSVLLTVLLC
jgi:hypothetical protein